MTLRLRTLALALLGSLALLAAGCGGATTSGSSQPEGASLVRPDALAFVSFDTDLGSSQWKQLEDLSEKFPDRDVALKDIQQELQKNHVDFRADVDPALGSEVDVAVVPNAGLTDVAVVGLTKPDEPLKFKALVRKLNESDNSGQDAVYRSVSDGWYALSDSQAHIDQVLKSGDKSLTDESTFADALGKLPDDALAKAYVNGPQFGKVAQQLGLGKGNGLAADDMTGLTKLDFISAALSAEDDGLRLHGATAGSGSSSLGNADYDSKLIDGVPADAFAFLSFKGAKSVDQLKEQLQTNPTFSQALPQIEAELGVKLSDLLALIRGEVGFYMRPGGALPEFSLALDTDNQSAALATLDKLATHLAAMGQGKVTTSQEGGRTVKTLDFMRFAIRYAGLGDKILITSGLNGIGAYTSSDSKLPASADFKEAKSAAGMPSSNSGFVYVDLKNAIALIEGLSGLSGSSLPPKAEENLRPLRSLVAWGNSSSDAFTFDAFLEIK